MANIRKLTNANIYVDGTNLLGTAKEIELPEAAFKFADHEALGMVGMTEFFAGLEKMESKITWNSFYPESTAFVYNPTQPRSFQVRASLEKFEAGGRTAEDSFVVYLTAAFKNAPAGKFAQHENVDFESNLAVYYMKIEVNSEEQVEIDLLSNIYRVAGVDIMANYRTNLGI
jgi:P2 family phage contractile tail tube protein